MDAHTATNMGTPIMPPDAKLLTLVQWLSPSFPVGAFAYSHGLEAAVDAGWVQDGAALAEWLRNVLAFGSGRTDAIWLRLAHAAADADADALVALNELASAYAPALSRRDEAERQGRAFVQTVRGVWAFDLPSMQLPLAVGAATARAEIDVDTAAQLYLHAFVSNLMSAAQRLLPLGQMQAQRLLAELQHDVLACAQCSRGATLADVSNTAFLSDIAAMRHETLEPRIFQS
ncbi:MAG: urease accessory UreF family protein [Pseudomonadota bacterium]